MKTLAGVLALLLLAVAGVTALGWTQRPDVRVPAGAAGSYVVVAGTPIRYLQSGSGPDVLLVHGSPGSIEDWDRVFGRLAQRFRVTAYDRPGHGYSGGADRPHTPAENAAVAVGLVRALGLADVTFVGHSYGATTALNLAIQDPKDARAYILVSARAYEPVHVAALFRVLGLPVFGPGLAVALSPFIGSARVREGVVTNFGPNADAIPAGFAESRARIWLQPTVSAALSQERVTLPEALAAMSPRYREIRKPVVVVCGEQDPNSEDSRRLARDIPGARLVMLPRTGHFVQYARPDRLAEVVEGAGTAVR